MGILGLLSGSLNCLWNYPLAVLTFSFLGKSIMSHDVLLGHTGERKDVLLKQTQEKKMFPEADSGERMFGYSKHIKGHLMKEHKYDLTDSGRQALVCSDSIFFVKTHMYWVSLHSIVELNLW